MEIPVYSGSFSFWNISFAPEYSISVLFSTSPRTTTRASYGKPAPDPAVTDKYVSVNSADCPFKDQLEIRINQIL
jgi:hypothetical protein